MPEFQLQPQRQRKIDMERYDSDFFYVTAALYIDGQWLVVWENKRVSEGDKLTLGEAHVQKARANRGAVVETPVYVEAVVVSVSK